MAQATGALRRDPHENRPRAGSRPSKAPVKSSAGRKPSKPEARRAARAKTAPPSRTGGASQARGRGRAPARTAQKKSVSRGGYGVLADKNWFAFASSVNAYMVLVPTVALLLLGLVMVFSAGQVVGVEQGVGNYRYFGYQIAWACLGLSLLAFFAIFDYRKLGKISWLGILFAFGLLVLVLVIGQGAYGARRWLDIGPVHVQPTEIAKFALILFCANVLANKSKKVKEFVHILPVLIAMIITAVLSMLQPDLGSTIIICVSIFILLVMAGANGKHLLAIGAAGTAVAVLLAFIEPYRFQRLLAFAHPEKYQQGASYQLMQSYIALGSGSVKGVGLGMSRQKFLYLPNAHNDFIFSIIGEELGLVGTLAVVALIGLLMYGGYRIAKNAPDQLGMLLSVGIVGLIVVQAIVNMGGVTGLMPITGVPLPLVSSGGSSLCISLGCIGILLNVAAQSETRKKGAS